MQPKFIEKPEFKVVGLECRTTMKNGKHKQDCPKVWMDFMKRIKELPNKHDGVCYGVCIMENENDFRYIACVESDADAPQGMVSEIIHASKYAVFTHKGKVGAIEKTWDYAYTKWLPKSGETINNDGICFELYDGRYKEDDSNETDIYVPIK
ncbi:GyrI-like domain-containing protein [Candidatus Woesearchaeota archaeon]|nr:GyrI-like domain-containing protein [Candidatus Woesearchaeota archaeon]